MVRFNNRDFRESSPEDDRYNCIAWAAGDTARFWWCVDSPFVYWPPTAPVEHTIAAFVAAFQTLGYEECGNGDLETGFIKVALYRDSSGKPTHAARQLPNGRWTSKLGRSFDVQHSLEEVEGAKYGHVVKFMRKQRS
jgi:hypothetical protein